MVRALAQVVIALVVAAIILTMFPGVLATIVFLAVIAAAAVLIWLWFENR